MLNDKSCFICLESIDDSNKHIFSEDILNNMPCNCYQSNYIHEQCFNNSFKHNIENLTKCLFCRSRINYCIQHNDYILESIKQNYYLLNHGNRT